MSIATSNELYINMKRTPSLDSSEYEDFALEEWRKVRDGIFIDGVYISGWLYWHINHWKIQIDGPNGSRPTVTPPLRDNEWMIAEAIQKGEDLKKIVCIAGTRQFGKTAISASYSTRKGTIIENSQNLIIGSSKPDLTNITNDIDFGLLNITEMFRIPRITRDWKSGEVYLGVKSKVGDNRIHSMFRIRNTEGGRNTEVTAGVRASSALIDEFGKGEFAKVLQALLPAMKGSEGLRAPVLITGTGGDMEKGKDAEAMFFDPFSNDCVEYVDEITGKKTGLFVPGWYGLTHRKDKETNLSEFLNIESEELKDVRIIVTDKEEALKSIDDERRIASKNSNPSVLLKKIMYSPITVDEIFLTEGLNIFPKDLLLDQKQFLAKHSPPYDCVELYIDGDNQIRHKFTDKKPITDFPFKPGVSSEGVIQIWEMPIENAPAGIYVAGSDPYKFSQGAYSDSIGSTYIFKRTYDIISDKFQNMIVAAYHGRPKKIDQWYTNTKLLLKFYNAKTLCENQDYGFIQHLLDKNEAPFYMLPTPRFLYDIHPNTQVGDKRVYGIHMTTEIKNYLNSCIIEYMTTVLKSEASETGEVHETLGVRKIIDPVLLEELLKYNDTGNFDRVISFGLTLAYAKSLDRTPVTTQKSKVLQEMFTKYKNTYSGPFVPDSSPFRK